MATVWHLVTSQDLFLKVWALSKQPEKEIGMIFFVFILIFYFQKFSIEVKVLQTKIQLTVFVVTFEDKNKI